MSLYHETASVLDGDAAAGGNLRSRVFNSRDLKSPRGQVYALAVESCKWSSILSEVIDHAQLLKHERKLTPVLSLLLVHDFLLAKGGIALPASHGLRATIERHRSRLTAEFSRARIRRKCSSVEALTEHVEASLHSRSQHPRWVRINTLKSTLDEQLATTFETYQRTDSIPKVLEGTGKLIYVDEHIPDLVAVPPRFDFAKCQAYKSGAIILQDKASCFPAYLLDPQTEDGSVIDGCAAPGNKTTHLAAIIRSRSHEPGPHASIYAFEKDAKRAKTLEKMVKTAGSDDFTQIYQGQDFLKVKPSDDKYRKVGAILLDPSCSGSGIVGRDDMPDLHLPTAIAAAAAAKGQGRASKDVAGATSKKRKRQGDDDLESEKVLIDDDGNTTVAVSEKDLQARLKALADFQLTILLHAFSFPATRKITYSTCSVHAEENELVVLKALQSDIARQRGWRVLPRESQVSGMQAWPVRGQADACDGNSEVGEACIRTYKDDGRGVMGFFVAAFIRDGSSDDETFIPPSRKSKKASPRGGDLSIDPPLLDVAESGIDEHGVEPAADLQGESDWDGFDD
ncbi:S-adenosyl-L-methionine-dependent methyltransferase [Cryphonectria parasitica EP155]|uniref:S-adenosyl-L-methionine-dependent methyltransferase n=1 Tax=Cryphonectria parasitica (strain ATCC 38755 / EP155) TaxID=660469 RepID=A0A9P4YCE9_CRYP1|nr:S-adenosyl-L-methionine-dependent methyltransferase [Cryphonectria parasitica EP155]KAF3770429.1 S-adenosyl-L-methionine-dependent methyltransferase [Cryphonectria parasitica EP155]